MKTTIKTIIKKYKKDKTRLLDIFWDIQRLHGHVSNNDLKVLSKGLGLSIPELKDTLTFYHFLHDRPVGKHQIYIDTSAISECAGVEKIIKAFEKELGCKMGKVDPSGKIALFPTSCIGMSDQAPAALINGVPITKLTASKARTIVQALKKNKKPESKVTNKVHQKGPVLFDSHTMGKSLLNLLLLEPTDVIEEVTKAGIRGRGGAGFSTGLKWKLCANQQEKTKYVVCNGDEGEPGTFKDRFLLTEKTALIFEGMIIAAHALGAQQGLFYLRAEYYYLLKHMEKVLEEMRKQNLLGKNILGVKGFHFDIRIQLGAGAYVVGEETALLESLEGKRGEPRVRPPFPVEEGYLGKPTVVNNVETFASVSKIIEHGAEWYRQYGTEHSPGTKLLSVSGDVKRPGIYEIEWGQTIGEFIAMVGAENPLAIQVGGPSGTCLNAMDIHRRIAFEDLATGGSMMVFNRDRDLLKIIKNFVQFFVDESCGCCLPCRAGNIVLNEQIDTIRAGDGARIDLERIKAWSQIISPASRCGLGQTCTNPMVTSMESFPDIYEKQVNEHEALFKHFDVEEKLKPYEETVELHHLNSEGHS